MVSVVDRVTGSQVFPLGCISDREFYLFLQNSKMFLCENHDFLEFLFKGKRSVAFSKLVIQSENQLVIVYVLKWPIRILAYSMGGSIPRLCIHPSSNLFA